MRPAYSYRNDPAVPDFPDDRPVIIFDGFCVLCSGWVNFVLKHDKPARFRLLPAQSPLGHALYVHLGLDPENYQSNILLSEGQAWLKSEGSIRMAEGLGVPWSLLGLARILPLRVRDWLYECIARNRFRIFGRREVCYRSDDAFADRFLA